MSWTATALSGWCSMDLHVHEDGTTDYGLCKLDETKCGCGCHRGERVTRRQPWHPDTVGLEDADDESDDDD